MSDKKSRVTALFSKYGKIGVVTYVGVGLSSWFLWYSLIKMGVDLKSQARGYGIDTENKNWQRVETAGPVVGGYIIHKLTAPVRIPLTFALIPIVAKVVGHTPK